MASGKITKTKNKRWYITITYGYDADGKQRRKRWTSKATTKAAATDEMNNELYNLNRLTRTGEAADNDYLLTDLYEQWVQSLSLRSLSQNTLDLYIRYGKDIVEQLKQNDVHTAEKLKPQDINNIALELVKSRSHNTVNKCIKYLKAMLEYGVDNDFIATNPLSKFKLLAEKPVKHRRALTPEEVQGLLEEATPVYQPIWRFFLSTGVRKSEFADLTWDNINLKNKTVRIVESKTETGKRTIPLSPAVIDDLKQCKDKTGYVFSTKDGARRSCNLVRELRRHMKRVLLKAAGLPAGCKMSSSIIKRNADTIAKINEDLKGIDLHALRYTFCTQLIGNGVDPKTAQQLMGHKSPDITLKIYSQYCPGNAENAIDKLPW